MSKIKLLGSILAIAFGAFLIVYGEMDDSPGGQLLGFLAVSAGIVGMIKSRKNKAVERLRPRLSRSAGGVKLTK